MSGLSTYDNKVKNNWRRWAWNRIKERCPVPPREARILYLPSHEDLDRPIAISKGFRTDNLIACEKTSKVVKQLRSQGVNVIHAKIAEVISAWPENWPLHGVVADLCCGVEKQVVDLAGSLYSAIGIASGSGIVVNVQRGRDYSWRDKHGTAKEARYVIEDEISKLRNWPGERHRGAHISFIFVQQQSMTSLRLGLALDWIVLEGAMLVKECDFTFNSYKSTQKYSNYFDSVAMSFPEMWAPEYSVMMNPSAIGPPVSVRRRIAAFRAVRTARLRPT